MQWDHVERCSCWRDTYSETELGKEIKRPCVLIQSVLSKLVTVSLLTVKNGRGLLKVFVLKRELTETMVSLVLCCGLSLLLRSTFRWCVHLLEQHQEAAKTNDAFAVIPVCDC